MPKPIDTTEFLQELNGGAFASHIGHALSKVDVSVFDRSQVGKITSSWRTSNYNSWLKSS